MRRTRYLYLSTDRRGRCARAVGKREATVVEAAAAAVEMQLNDRYVLPSSYSFRVCTRGGVWWCKADLMDGLVPLHQYSEGSRRVVESEVMCEEKLISLILFVFDGLF